VRLLVGRPLCSVAVIRRLIELGYGHYRLGGRSDLAEIKAVRGGAALKVTYSSATIQVLSAGLAEFNKETEPAFSHIVQHLVHGAVRPKVGLNDRVELRSAAVTTARGDASLIRPSKAKSLAKSEASSFWWPNASP
jgi:hypothetical protein